MCTQLKTTPTSAVSVLGILTRARSSVVATCSTWSAWGHGWSRRSSVRRVASLSNWMTSLRTLGTDAVAKGTKTVIWMMRLDSRTEWCLVICPMNCLSGELETMKLRRTRLKAYLTILARKLKRTPDSDSLRSLRLILRKIARSSVLLSKRRSKSRNWLMKKLTDSLTRRST